MNTFKHTHKVTSPANDKIMNSCLYHIFSKLQLMTKLILDFIKALEDTPE